MALGLIESYNRTRYVEELLENVDAQPPSFTVHLHPEYWILNNGSKFLYHNQIASLLDDIRAHRIPVDFLDLFDSADVPFYEGCMVVELLDYRAQKSNQPLPDKPERTRVILHPNPETLYADVCSLNQRNGGTWSDNDAIEIEAKLLLAITPPLCLDPNPHLSRIANHILRASTPTVPISLKRKAATMEPEEDESEKTRRAKIMAFMTPRQTTRKPTATYSLLDSIVKIRKDKEAEAQNPTTIPIHPYLLGPPPRPHIPTGSPHPPVPVSASPANGMHKKEETPQMSFSNAAFLRAAGSNTPVPQPTQPTHQFINQQPPTAINATPARVYANVQAATDAAAAAAAAANRTPTPAQHHQMLQQQVQNHQHQMQMMQKAQQHQKAMQLQPSVPQSSQQSIQSPSAPQLPPSSQNTSQSEHQTATPTVQGSHHGHGTPTPRPSSTPHPNPALSTVSSPAPQQPPNPAAALYQGQPQYIMQVPPPGQQGVALPSAAVAQQQKAHITFQQAQMLQLQNNHILIHKLQHHMHTTAQQLKQRPNDPHLQQQFMQLQKQYKTFVETQKANVQQAQNVGIMKPLPQTGVVGVAAGRVTPQAGNIIISNSGHPGSASTATAASPSPVRNSPSVGVRQLMPQQSQVHQNGQQAMHLDPQQMQNPQQPQQLGTGQFTFTAAFGSGAIRNNATAHALAVSQVNAAKAGAGTPAPMANAVGVQQSPQQQQPQQHSLQTPQMQHRQLRTPQMVQQQLRTPQMQQQLQLQQQQQLAAQMQRQPTPQLQQVQQQQQQQQLAQQRAQLQLQQTPQQQQQMQQMQQAHAATQFQAYNYAAANYQARVAMLQQQGRMTPQQTAYWMNAARMPGAQGAVVAGHPSAVQAQAQQMAAVAAAQGGGAGMNSTLQQQQQAAMSAQIVKYQQQQQQQQPR